MTAQAFTSVICAMYESFISGWFGDPAGF